jgi:hypothetical protein
MSTIREYEVIQPPTSGELREQIIASLGSGSMVAVQGRPEAADLGPRDVVDVEMEIVSTLHPKDGSMRALGETAAGKTINLQLSADKSAPASFSMVFDFDN